MASRSLSKQFVSIDFSRYCSINFEEFAKVILTAVGLLLDCLIDIKEFAEAIHIHRAIDQLCNHSQLYGYCLIDIEWFVVKIHGDKPKCVVDIE